MAYCSGYSMAPTCGRKPKPKPRKAVCKFEKYIDECNRQKKREIRDSTFNYNLERFVASPDGNFNPQHCSSPIEEEEISLPYYTANYEPSDEFPDTQHPCVQDYNLGKHSCTAERYTIECPFYAPLVRRVPPHVHPDSLAAKRINPGPAKFGVLRMPEGVRPDPRIKCVQIRNPQVHLEGAYFKKSEWRRMPFASKPPRNLMKEFAEGLGSPERVEGQRRPPRGTFDTSPRARKRLTLPGTSRMRSPQAMAAAGPSCGPLALPLSPKAGCSQQSHGGIRQEAHEPARSSRKTLDFAGSSRRRSPEAMGAAGPSRSPLAVPMEAGYEFFPITHSGPSWQRDSPPQPRRTLDFAGPSRRRSPEAMGAAGPSRSPMAVPMGNGDGYCPIPQGSRAGPPRRFQSYEAECLPPFPSYPPYYDDGPDYDDACEATWPPGPYFTGYYDKGADCDDS